MSFQATKRYGGNFNACDLVKEANLESLHILRYTSLWKKQKQKQNLMETGVSGKGGMNRQSTENF